MRPCLCWRSVLVLVLHLIDGSLGGVGGSLGLAAKPRHFSEGLAPLNESWRPGLLGCCGDGVESTEGCRQLFSSDSQLSLQLWWRESFLRWLGTLCRSRRLCSGLLGVDVNPGEKLLNDVGVLTALLL